MNNTLAKSIVSFESIVARVTGDSSVRSMRISRERQYGQMVDVLTYYALDVHGAEWTGKRDLAKRLFERGY